MAKSIKGTSKMFGKRLRYKEAAWKTHMIELERKHKRKKKK